ncbi:HNH endonuclease [Paraburkholderia bryophila]|uniref:HNH endonuclease n=1 Tax=Paraburkholderia bryophila TaxID=420952 RepID=A0A329C7V2_9BURK|nr:HNH endonuclease [Paraburkholderia bryophila]RAS29782.1 hypothetical protein BX591_11057 [Paraburkholderia bryophila]
MSKKYRGKTCVYCGLEKTSSTADHVIARQFFGVADRGNQPKVPACEACNNAKSQLELYILSVMPMGGLQKGVGDMILNQVKPRLSKNDALRAALANGSRPRFFWNLETGWQEGMTLPFDGDKLAKLSTFIARGLAWYHWGLQLAPVADMRANMFSARGEEYWENAWNHPDFVDHIDAVLGSGVFQYRGARSRKSPLVSLWQMSYFGGATLGDTAQRGESARSIFVASQHRDNWPSAAAT